MLRIGIFFLTIAIFIFCIDDQTFRKQFIQNITGHIHQSAAVVAKIDHKILHSFFFQLI